VREMPDIRKEVHPYFDTLKAMLAQNVEKGTPFAPLFIYVTLTPYGQAQMGKPETICIAPEWKSDAGKEQCILSIVEILNRYARSAILCGSGRGIYTGFGDGEVTYIFVTMYVPGFTPWTLAQVYTTVEKEVIFDVECCSADGTVSFFELPGLWPNEGT
jgi:hypothetical protein